MDKSDNKSENICEIEHDYAANHTNDNRCAPSKQFENESCIPLDLLILLADAYNKSVGKKIILVDAKYNKCPSQYKKYLLKKISKELKQCQDQKCWMAQDFARHLNREKFEELTTNTFRPEGPQGKFEWLNTVNINNVMQQYELKYPDFKFLEAVPMDFMELGYYGFIKEELIKLHNSNNINKIGIIFNLDNHDQSGSHWVALYSDFKKKQIYFSDSVGNNPHKNVANYMNILKDTINDINSDASKKIDVKINKVQHQKGNSECGVYSLNFIIRLLDGDTFNKFCETRISDGEINKFRDIYFTKK